MIPDKEPLISRRDKRDLKYLLFLQQKNTSLHEPLNSQSQNTSTTLVSEKPSEKEVLLTQEEESTSNTYYTTIVPFVPILSKLEKYSKRTRQAVSTRRNLQYYSALRLKRSLKEPLQRKTSDKGHFKSLKDKTIEEDPLIISQNIPDQENNIDQRESRENTLRLGRQGRWIPQYKIYHYDSYAVEYDYPFPMVNYRQKNKPVSVAHGAEIATAQIFPIIKRMVLGSTRNSTSKVWLGK